MPVNALKGSSLDHPWLLDGHGQLVRPMRGLEGSSRRNPYVFDARGGLVLMSTARLGARLGESKPQGM